MRTMIKKVEKSEDKEQAVPLLNETKALLDRMVSKNLIHDNKAARYKSRLDKHVNSL